MNILDLVFPDNIFFYDCIFKTYFLTQWSTYAIGRNNFKKFI